MPYICSPEASTTKLSMTTGRYPRPTSPVKEVRSIEGIKARAAGQHKFIVANMFGPIDWDYDMLSDEESELQEECKSQTISSSDCEYDIVSDEEDLSLPASEIAETAPGVATMMRAKSTFERGIPLCEANMFGPLDWAFELMGGSAFLEGDVDVALTASNVKQVA